MAKPSEKQMQAFRKLGYSDEQIAEMLEDDETVDRDRTGTALEWDMNPEEHKKAVKFANVDEHKPKAKKKKTPVRKPNEVKAGIVEYLSECMADYEDVRNCVITNKERMVAFECATNGKRYEITLIEKREPKEKK